MTGDFVVSSSPLYLLRSPCHTSLFKLRLCYLAPLVLCSPATHRAVPERWTRLGPVHLLANFCVAPRVEYERDTKVVRDSHLDTIFPLALCMRETRTSFRRRLSAPGTTTFPARSLVLLSRAYSPFFLSCSDYYVIQDPLCFHIPRRKRWIM